MTKHWHPQDDGGVLSHHRRVAERVRQMRFLSMNTVVIISFHRFFRPEEGGSSQDGVGGRSKVIDP